MIAFPYANDLLEGMEIKYFKSDLTREDLNNKDIIKELREKGLINTNEEAYFKGLAIRAKEEK